jgi:hypothetical protein
MSIPPQTVLRGCAGGGRLLTRDGLFVVHILHITKVASPWVAPHSPPAAGGHELLDPPVARAPGNGEAVAVIVLRIVGLLALET